MKRFQIYIINRTRDSERLDLVKVQLDRLGLPFQRVPAVEPADLTDDMVRELVVPRLSRTVTHLLGYRAANDRGPMVYMPEHQRYLVATEICCALSHQRALSMMLEAGDENAVILEDDVEIDSDLVGVIDAATALPPTARIVKLEGLSPTHRYNVFVAHASNRKLAMMLKPTTASAGYLVTREAAIKLLQRMIPIREPYDAFLRQYWRHGIDFLEVVPFPVRQLAFPTTIAGRTTGLTLPAFSIAVLAVARPLHKFYRFLNRLVTGVDHMQRQYRLRFRLGTLRRYPFVERR